MLLEDTGVTDFLGLRAMMYMALVNNWVANEQLQGSQEEIKQVLELRVKSSKDVRIQSYWVTISVY